MESGSLTNDKKQAHGDAVLDEQFKVGVIPGDVIWIRLCGTSWWPAQIVDEKAVSDSIKPRSAKADEVLVRLYGSYHYVYVDPLTSNLEFNKVLKRHKGNHKEIIQKGLKQDFSESQGGSRVRSSKNKGQSGTQNAAEYETTPCVLEQERKKMKPSSPNSDVALRESGGSARRLKVMQGLGLTAPLGSPFLKSGRVMSIIP